MLAEAVGLGVAHRDELAAEVIPEGVVAVARHGWGHLGDDAVGEEGEVEANEVEADEGEEAAGPELVATEAGLDDEATELGGAGLVGVELADGVGGSEAELRGVELLLADAEGPVGIAGAALMGADLAGADDGAGLGIFDGEHEEVGFLFDVGPAAS